MNRQSLDLNGWIALFAIPVVTLSFDGTLWLLLLATQIFSLGLSIGELAERRGWTR